MLDCIGYELEFEFVPVEMNKNADYIIRLAEPEGMRAHALAVKVRK